MTLGRTSELLKLFFKLPFTPQFEHLINMQLSSHLINSIRIRDWNHLCFYESIKLLKLHYLITIKSIRQEAFRPTLTENSAIRHTIKVDDSTIDKHNMVFFLFLPFFYGTRRNNKSQPISVSISQNVVKLSFVIWIRIPHNVCIKCWANGVISHTIHLSPKVVCYLKCALYFHKWHFRVILLFWVEDL